MKGCGKKIKGTFKYCGQKPVTLEGRIFYCKDCQNKSKEGKKE